MKRWEEVALQIMYMNLILPIADLEHRKFRYKWIAMRNTKIVGGTCIGQRSMGGTCIGGNCMGGTCR